MIFSEATFSIICVSEDKRFVSSPLFNLNLKKKKKKSKIYFDNKSKIISTFYSDQKKKCLEESSLKEL